MIPPTLAACAPYVAPATIEAVIRVESGGNPLAIYVNHGHLPHTPIDTADAISEAKRLIADGYSVDLGLMQVNSRNLVSLGIAVERIFDACTNVRAGATILAAGYVIAIRSQGEGQAALRTALSIYNTGDPVRGYQNGYVAKYLGKTAQVPVLIGTAAVHTNRLPSEPPPNPYTAGTTILFVGEREVNAEPRGSMNPYTAATTIPLPSHVSN